MKMIASPSTRQTSAVLCLSPPQQMSTITHNKMENANMCNMPNVIGVSISVVTTVMIPANNATSTPLLKLFLEKEQEMPQSSANSHTTMSCTV